MAKLGKGRGGRKKVKGGFKAVTKAGRPLSKKPKSKKAANKQVAAVKISQARRAGKY